MARLYADEDFDFDVVIELRLLGHDVLTVQEARNSGGGDPQVLSDATAMDRTMMTFNRRHFVRLARQVAAHPGIVICTRDPDKSGLAHRIHAELASALQLTNQVIRVVKPHKP